MRLAAQCRTGLLRGNWRGDRADAPSVTAFCTAARQVPLKSAVPVDHSAARDLLRGRMPGCWVDEYSNTGAVSGRTHRP